MTGLGLPQITYGPDGEGRVNQVTASSGHSPVTAAFTQGSVQLQHQVGLKLTVQ